MRGVCILKKKKQPRRNSHASFPYCTRKYPTHQPPNPPTPPPPPPPQRQKEQILGLPIGGKKQLHAVEIRAGVAGQFGAVTIVKPFLLRPPGAGPPPKGWQEEEGGGVDEEEVRACVRACVVCCFVGGWGCV